MADQQALEIHLSLALRLQAHTTVHGIFSDVDSGYWTLLLLALSNLPNPTLAV